MKRLVPIAALLMLAAGPAIAHVGHGSTASFAAGLGHPLGGLDHVTVMVLVGLWAGLKGGRSIWVWPATFVGVGFLLMAIAFLAESWRCLRCFMAMRMAPKWRER